MSKNPRIEVIKANNAPETFRFTVDNNELSVPIATVNPSDPIERRMASLLGDYVFEGGENINLLSFGLELPAGYNLVTGTDSGDVSETNSKNGSFLLQMVDTTNNVLATPFTSFYPFGNYECAVSGFIDHRVQGAGADGFYLAAQLSNCWVDMKGIPSSENGKVYYVAPFIKVAHNKSLGV